jgi:hypothetical protein
MMADKKGRAELDAAISLWRDKDDVLRFIDIHRGLIEKGIVQKDSFYYKTNRILKQLQEKGAIEKIRRGEYRLLIDPLGFRLFDRLSDLRGEEEMARLRIGGVLWTACELHVLGFPEEALGYDYVHATLDVLGIRLCEIFQALKALSDEVYRNGVNGALPLRVIRELMLELQAYYLGSKAGVDGDGLSVEELQIALEPMLQALPEEVESEEGWKTSTEKKSILKDFTVLKNVSSIPPSPRLLDDEEPAEGKPRNFALIATEAEWKLDEEGYEERSITRVLQESRKRDAFPTAYTLLRHNEKTVITLLDTVGSKYLGEKASEVENQYRRLLASREIAMEIMPIVYYLYRLEEGKVTTDERQINKHLKDLKRRVKQKAVEHGAEELIKLFPLHNVFGGLTPHKEEAVGKVFTNISRERIHALLSSGDKLAHELADEAISEMANIFRADEEKEG